MTPDLILFFSLALLAVVTAIGMLTSHNPVYSTLLLVVNFVVVAVLYLLLQAAFIAMVQVTVYAGAIMVLFLFVVMLLGAERLPRSARLRWQVPAAAALGVALFAQAILVIWMGRGAVTRAAPPRGFGSPAEVSRLLFREFVVPIEVASILLLAAMVGAIVLSRRERRNAG